MPKMRISPRYRPSGGAQPQSRHFVDRKEALAAFRQALSDQPADEQRVLNFYGVGGIGKSRLQQELRDLQAREGLGISVRLDFQLPATRRQDAAIYQLRHCLQSEHGMQLPCFDIAYALYWQRANPKTPLSADELPLLSESEILGDIVSAAGDVPVVGGVVSLIKALDRLGRGARRWHRVRDDSDLQNLDRLDTHELLDALTYFFARDLMHALRERDQRCVILLDAHDALWEDVTARGGRGNRDAWIRDAVCQTPGVLWVVSSRDPLRWKVENPEWIAPHLQHRELGDLSKADRLEFLAGCGVDGDVAHVIADASKGVPFYLNVSVDHWESLKQKGEPNPGDFGTSQDDLLSRFVGHIPHAEEELVKVLSVPRAWDRQVFELLIRRFNISFPLSRWPDFCSYSFNRQTSRGRWVMHSLMRDELRRRLSKETTLEVHRAIFSHEQAEAEDEGLAPMRRLDSFREAVFHGLSAGCLAPAWFEAKAKFFMLRGLWTAMSEVVDEMQQLFTHAPASSQPVFRALGQYIDAWILRQQGCLAEAKAAYEALDMVSLKPFEPGIRFQTANVLREIGKTKEAHQVYQDLWSHGSKAIEPELRRLVGIQYADIHYVQGRFTQAKAILDDMASLEDQAAAREVAEAKRILGHIDRLNECGGRGIALYREARQLFGSCKDRFGVAMTVTNFAEALWLADPQAALRHGQEAVELNEALGARLEVGKARTATALAHCMLGEPRRALSEAREAVATQVEVGYRAGEAQACLANGIAHALLGNAPAATEAALRAGAIFEAMEAYPTLRLLTALVLERLDTGTRAQSEGLRDRARPAVHWLDDAIAGEARLARVADGLLGG